MRIGILDFCPVRPGRPPQESLHETLRLAQEAEALGYSRYWLAEHHEPQYAQHVPDLMAGLIASHTRRIRVGVAGVLLRLHSPMRVAKTFSVLEALFPGRIDLGMAGGGAEPAVTQAMRAFAPPVDAAPVEFHAQVRSLLELIQDGPPLPFNPRVTPPPALWLLGMSSLETARLAAHQGLGFGFSLAHPQSKDDPSIPSIYLSEFRPTPQRPEPELVIAVRGLCAESERDALRHMRPGLQKRGLHNIVLGSPEKCRERMEEVCHRYGTNELVFYDVAATPDARLRNYRLLATVREPATTRRRGPRPPGPAKPRRR